MWFKIMQTFRRDKLVQWIAAHAYSDSDELLIVFIILH